ncbi:hypothetical protein BDV11DRAFT_175589 [Aspergillus similis]
MTSLNLSVDDIPRLDGKTAIITGGCSGIGWESAQLLAAKGATVYVLDIHPPPTQEHQGSEEEERKAIHYRPCDVTSWPTLRAVFDEVPQVDIAVANAGVSEECDYFADTWDAEGKLEEPRYAVVEVNYRAVLNFVKLSLSAFRRAGNKNGSLVLTTSATAYSPEHTCRISTARPSTVAPAATITNLLPANLAAPIMAAGAPVSTAQHVALAVAYSATASQENSVESYGNDGPEQLGPGRWNGRVILTLGDKWTELEEPLAERRSGWFGAWNTEKTAFQQKLTDMRFGGLKEGE